MHDSESVWIYLDEEEKEEVDLEESPLSWALSNRLLLDVSVERKRKQKAREKRGTKWMSEKQGKSRKSEQRRWRKTGLMNALTKIL
jgi:hypothetical protein